MFDGNQSKDELDIFVMVNQEGGNIEVGGSHNESGGSDNGSGGSEESMYAAATDEESHDTSVSLVASEPNDHLFGYKSDDHSEAENLSDKEFCSDPMKGGALSRDACVVHGGFGWHATLGIAHRREELETYTDARFSKQKYMKAYGHCIHPILDPSFWPEEMDVTPTDLKPPTIKRMLGRPKKSRRKEPGEATGAIRRANVLKCKICNGHNRRTCPNDDVDLNVPVSQLAKRRAGGKMSRNETLGSSSSQPLPTNRDELMPVSAPQPLPRTCSRAEVAQKRPTTKKPKSAPKPAPIASTTHTLRTIASSQPLPSELLFPLSLFRSIGVPSNV
ncbi:hypothetical protein Salat_2162100 [Sesamum alatum]|uniref:Uncharacterized protein n=1 Tax=Sesamum alatum TaxID=300844 RepID=A0AAE1Y1K7_9LAMI|nr:hypothetical protein Salat_2162100 [Sesamum alatum]